MAYDCDSAKAELLADYIVTESNNWDAYWMLYNANIDWNAGDDHAAIINVIDACFIFFCGINALARKDTNYDPPYYLPYLWEHCSGEITARAICEAWAKNGFEERALTIAFIDRMRALIWDEPFYITWAARPESESE